MRRDRPPRPPKRPLAPYPPWPPCPCCDGPARPLGRPSLDFRFEVETRSESNLRDRFAAGERKKAQRDRTLEELSAALALPGQRLPEVGPWYVRLKRISPGRRLDKDNLGRALKAVQDAVAAALGVDDGDPAIEFSCAQGRGGDDGESDCAPPFLGVRVTVWGELGAPGIGWRAPPSGLGLDELDRAHVPVERMSDCTRHWLIPRWAEELLTAAIPRGGLLTADNGLGLRAVVDACLRAPDPEEHARAACSAIRLSGVFAAVTLGSP